MEISTFKYYWLDTWVLANVIQLTTQDFCMRFLNQNNDPCGRLFDQMTMAARSVPANIAEGSSRHSTSRETEMKLIDVARASLSELSNDYLNWILRCERVPWSTKEAAYQMVNNIQLDRPTYKDDVLHLSSKHILAQKHKFDQWLTTGDSLTAANCLIILCNRLIMMLRRQIEHLLESFKAEGGFTEGLTAERLAFRQQQSIKADAPTCPVCGKPMIKRMAKKASTQAKNSGAAAAIPNATAH